MVERFSKSSITEETNQVELLIRKCTEALMKENKTIVLFGAGVIGAYYLGFLKKYKVGEHLIFCDNSPAKWGTMVEGIPVISLDELKNRHRDSYILITSLQYRDEILLLLEKNNLSKNLIDSLADNIIVTDANLYEMFNGYRSIVEGHFDMFDKTFDILSDDYSKKIFYDRINYCVSFNNKYLISHRSADYQYFESDIIKLSDDEIFIDGGAYVGDTVDEFIKQTGGAFKKIYSFEPEATKCREFREKYAAVENIHLLPYGLWSKKTILRFTAEDSQSSQINEGGNIEVPVTSIDEVLGGEPVTFIKMDIEGAELEALRGAERSIRKYKPKLAICIYHKPLDMVEIPLYLKELVPEYKIYFRHYSNGAAETVCYAVAKD